MIQAKDEPKIFGAYAAPVIVATMLSNPVFIIQGVYIKYFEFSMAGMATILLVSRLFDAVTDPLVGAISDWQKEKSGRRKPLIFLGFGLLLLGGCFLYLPASNPTYWSFTAALIVLYLGITVFWIPHSIWGSELTSTSVQKAKIFSYHTGAGYAGLAIFYSIPLLPFFETTEITPLTLKVCLAAALVISVPVLWLCMRFVPEGPKLSTEVDLDAGGQWQAIFFGMTRILSNGPFALLLCAFFVVSIAGFFWYSMIFIFVDVYLQAGELFAPLFLVSFLIGILAPYGWSKLSLRLNNKGAWTVGIGVGIVSVLSTSLIAPANVGVVQLGLVLFGMTVFFAANGVFSNAILGEVVDYSTFRYGRNYGASYYAFFVFTSKIVQAVGGAMGLALAAWLGFDPLLEIQMADGVFALNIVMAWLPASLMAAAIVLVHLIPLDARRHAIVRKRLEQRALRNGDASV